VLLLFCVDLESMSGSLGAKRNPHPYADAGLSVNKAKGGYPRAVPFLTARVM
jgi:hypothetical protein